MKRRRPPLLTGVAGTALAPPDPKVFRNMIAQAISREAACPARHIH